MPQGPWRESASFQSGIVLVVILVVIFVAVFVTVR